MSGETCIVNVRNPTADPFRAAIAALFTIMEPSTVAGRAVHVPAPAVTLRPGIMASIGIASVARWPSKTFTNARLEGGSGTPSGSLAAAVNWITIDQEPVTAPGETIRKTGIDCVTWLPAEMEATI